MSPEQGKQEPIQTLEESVFQGLEGVYRGFAPTGQPRVGMNVVMGEFELTITQKTLQVRLATPRRQIEKSLLLAGSGISEMSVGEVKELLTDPTAAERVRAFKLGEKPFLLFDEKEEIAPSVRMIADDLKVEELGSTTLFSPKQLKQGLFELALLRAYEMYEDVGDVPRLRNNGEASLR